MFLRRAYFIYAVFLFFLTFLLVLPGFALVIYIKKWQHHMRLINKIWCSVFFPLVGVIPKHVGAKIVKGPAILIANHSSYFDIPVLTDIMNRNHAFVGKDSLGKIPLFGFMYRGLHILLNRESTRDRKKTFALMGRALRAGKVVVLFPEGGIKSKMQPGLSRFYDGAFQAAIKFKVPIQAVSLPLNWKIFPDDGTYTARHINPLVIVHEPVATQSLTQTDAEMLKDSLYSAILHDIRQHNPGVEVKHHEHIVRNS